MGCQTCKQTLTPQPGARPTTGGVLQRQCACGTHTSGGEQCEACGKKKNASLLQRAAINDARAHEVPPIVNEVVQSAGQPLDEATRGFFESRFDHDFSKVRVHTDVRSVESARAVSALAYTVGPHIVFGAGRYAPGTDSGRRLLAHELTHTIQQGMAGQQFAGKLEMGDSRDPSEDEADFIAECVVSGGHVPAIGPAGGSRIQRIPEDQDPSGRSRGGTLPYRQAKDLADCLRIMGDANRDYCYQEVLGEEPPPNCLFEITYANQSTGSCPGRLCGSSITFDITEVRAIGGACPPRLAGLRLTEVVTNDHACIPIDFTTGAGCVITAHPSGDPQRGQILNCTDNYTACGPVSRLPQGNCIETATQELFIDGRHAETHTLRFRFNNTASGCTGSATRT